MDLTYFLVIGLITVLNLKKNKYFDVVEVDEKDNKNIKIVIQTDYNSV